MYWVIGECKPGGPGYTYESILTAERCAIDMLKSGCFDSVRIERESKNGYLIIWQDGKFVKD